MSSTQNVFERIQTFNQGHDSRLIALKYQVMRSDVFAFYRGTDHLFYQDWPETTPLDAVPAAWICGDLHLQNLGSYKGDNRLVYFNINDFDEAILAPCTWDLARFLTCLYVSSDFLGIQESKVEKLCAYFLKVYSATLLKGHIRPVEEDNSIGIARELLFQLKRRRRKDFLNGHTMLKNGTRRLLINGKQVQAAAKEEQARVTTMMEAWAARQQNPQFYHVLDVAHRIAGIGSLGVDRYIVLAEGKGSPNGNFLLDLKAESCSSLQPYAKLTQPQWSNQAERTVMIQRWVQGIPPALLAAVTLQGNAYVLREMQPTEDKVNLDLVCDKYQRVKQLVKMIAKVVAWGQLRSAGHQGAAAAFELMDFARSDTWHSPLLKYACSYAETVRQDYRAFCETYDRDYFKADVD